jgi:hypothetical protein
VGGNQEARAGALVRCALVVMLAVAAASCDDDDPSNGNVNVTPAAAYVAIVEWQVSEQEPVFNDAGEVVVPVVFVAADDGTTIDVGVQAEVAEATADWATVRFADLPSETFDPSVESEPVRDDGVMLLVGPVPEAAPSVELSVVRYRAANDSESFLVRVTATPGPSDTSAISPRASVSSVSSVPQP